MSSTLTVLTPAEVEQLGAAGVSDDEIAAVDSSIANSVVLAVKSFVDEVNDGEQSSLHVVRRESHGKHQGCLRARFEITSPDSVGIFQSGAAYPAWIRLSNGGAYQRDDRSRHISRGFAIKVLNVDRTQSGTHDFLLITSPRFFIRDLTHYPAFLKSSGENRPAQVFNFLFHLSAAERNVIEHRLALKVDDLLRSCGYSAVPYRFGHDVVKYAIAPGSSVPPAMPQPHDPPQDASVDYLEDAMNATLLASAGEPVSFGFFIQRARAGDSIDDPTTAWDGPFEPVGRITIPSGQHRGGPFDYRNNESVAERLSFDPFNAATESQPVGRTNLVRQFVYARLARFRRRELAALFERWRSNNQDQTVPGDVRNALSHLNRPEAVEIAVQDEREPEVDQAFRSLGIVS